MKSQNIVLTEQITSINKDQLLGRKIGTIQQTVYEEKVKQAIQIQLNL